MSEVRTLHVDRDNVTRTRSGTTTGSGGEQHMPFGQSDGDPAYIYRSYLRFAMDWSQVGQIVSAALVVYTGPGTHLHQGATPTLKALRLTSTFSEGSNGENVFDSGDATSPTYTLAGTARGAVVTSDGLVNRIDITDIMEAWAPSTVMKRDGKTPGGSATNYGLRLSASSETVVAQRGELYSNHATDSSKRPTIELTYLLGVTVPDVPSNLTPAGGGGISTFTGFEGDFTDTKTTDYMTAVDVQVYLNGGLSPIWGGHHVVSNSERVAAHFIFNPTDWQPTANVNYEFRARVFDSEGQVSAWSALGDGQFFLDNTAPVAPVLSPLATTFDSLSGVRFRGAYSDADNDDLAFYQVQLADLPVDDAGWDLPGLPWDTGKRPATAVQIAADQWDTVYGGTSLAAGTYRWRARHWDVRGGVSAWTYTTITLSADFVVTPAAQPMTITDAPRPWRVVLRDMTNLRGPNNVVAVIEDPKAIGATIMFNSGGEFHMTLPVDHPQISVCEPKQTHYAVEFRQGDGWREVFAGLLDDFLATETEVIFYGVDYLALLDRIYDERFTTGQPNLDNLHGGSKYVDRSLDYIINDQLSQAIAQTNSPVGFISVGSIPSFSEHATIWSTLQPTLQFCAGLIDSHRQGTGLRTRLTVDKNPDGTYQFNVVDNPGTDRTDLRLVYGELVQGYQVQPFGNAWADRISTISRQRDGLVVFYKQADSPGIDQSVWGRESRATILNDVSDENDAIRRTKQLAATAGRVGKQIGVAIRSGFLAPRDGYDVTDSFPIGIVHGAVDTANYGSGLWTCWGITWEGRDDAVGDVVLTLAPKEDASSPDTDLIPASPISPQAEWQIGWQPPDPDVVSSVYYLDQSTGIVYLRDDSTGTPVYSPVGSAGSAFYPEVPTPPSVDSVTTDVTPDADGHPIVWANISLTPSGNVGSRGTIVFTDITSDGTTSTVSRVLPYGTNGLRIQVPGGADLSVTAKTIDVYGQVSAASSATTATAVIDSAAPGIPQGLAATAGTLGFIASWLSTNAADLAFYEVRYAIDDGTGTAPDTTAWQTFRSKTTAVWVGGLTDRLYWVEVRAVDTSGNIEKADLTTGNYLTDPDEGWTAAVSVTPLLVRSNTLGIGEVMSSHISIDGLDAGVIRSGDLSIDTGSATKLDGIKVYDGATLVGWWDEDGLRVYSATDPTDYILLSNGGLTVYIDGNPTTVLGADGLSASAITFGALPGGHNLVKNASFELSPFPATPTPVDWTLKADWDASRVGSDTNVSADAGDLAQTAVTY